MIKKFIQNYLRSFGVALHRVPTDEQIADLELTKMLWLKSMDIKTIIDIGANTGQFATYIREVFPNAMLYSFEPLLDCYRNLISNFKDSNTFKAFNVALGAETGKLQFIIMSFLRPLPYYR